MSGSHWTKVSALLFTLLTKFIVFPPSFNVPEVNVKSPFTMILLESTLLKNTLCPAAVETSKSAKLVTMKSYAGYGLVSASNKTGGLSKHLSSITTVIETNRSGCIVVC